MPKTSPRSSTGFDKIVGKYIREIRKAAKTSQTKLAGEIGITFQQVQKYENGSNRVTVERFAQICKALDVKATECLSEILERSAKDKANA